jgi:transcriptional regulator with XRE-family HTH domain
MTKSESKEGTLGELIRRQRLMMSLTLGELTERSGVSSSHLGRIERGERFPSARVLRKIARPLGFREDELFSLAEYLPSPATVSEEGPIYLGGRLDPYVAKLLSQESIEVQRAIIGILNIMKSLAGGMNRE